MAAILADTILNRARSLLVASPFAGREVHAPFSFDLAPDDVIDTAFRFEVSSIRMVGGFGYREDRTDLLTVWVAKPHNSAPTTCYAGLVTMAHSLTSALVWDAHAISGDYAVLDEGRTQEIGPVRGGNYLALRLDLPVSYEAVLYEPNPVAWSDGFSAGFGR